MPSQEEGHAGSKIRPPVDPDTNGQRFTEAVDVEFIDVDVSRGQD